MLTPRLPTRGSFRTSWHLRMPPLSAGWWGAAFRIAEVQRLEGVTTVAVPAKTLTPSALACASVALCTCTWPSLRHPGSCSKRFDNWIYVTRGSGGTDVLIDHQDKGCEVWSTGFAPDPM